MLIEIARKQEFNNLLKDKVALFEEKDMLSINPRMYNLIGKDLIMQDSRDPLGASTKGTAE